MKALVLHGPNEDLKVEEVEQPAIGPHEALVQIKAAGLNKRDWWIQKGQYAGLQFPIILGSDGSGVVTAVGTDVPLSWVGQEVVLYPAENWGDKEQYQGKDFQILGLPSNGCFAEFVKVKSTMLFPKPQHLNFEQTAALPIAGLTAFRALFIKANWQSGDKVFVAGVGGGAGTFALQFAVAAGAEVWVSSGSCAKIEQAILLGAKGGVNYKDEHWAQQLKDQAGLFDVIIDSALGEGFTFFPEICHPGARIIFFGGTAGNIPAVNGRPVFWKQLSILGTTLGSPGDFDKMLTFIQDKKVRPIIDKVYPMQEANEALQSMNGGTSKFGKSILNIVGH